MCWTISWPGVVTFWILVTVRLPSNMFLHLGFCVGQTNDIMSLEEQNFSKSCLNAKLHQQGCSLFSAQI